MSSTETLSTTRKKDCLFLRLNFLSITVD